ncbi:hypothetical protein N7453_001953 [Penicillium expansum]|nr:hypothetical protein N7453_001953 [Penicillium expansum]
MSSIRNKPRGRFREFIAVTEHDESYADLNWLFPPDGLR